MVGCCSMARPTASTNSLHLPFYLFIAGFVVLRQADCNVAFLFFHFEVTISPPPFFDPIFTLLTYYFKYKVHIFPKYIVLKRVLIL